MTRSLLVRHGETTWNAEGRYQGQTDVPLSGVGRWQARMLARRLAREDIDVIYASDLRRAWGTAEVIAATHGLPVRAEPRLREIGFGAWEGLTNREIEERAPEALAVWHDDPLNTAAPGGETLAQVAERVGSALDDITEGHSDETVLVVAHGGTLRLLLCLGLRVSPAIHWQFRLDVASLSEVDIYEEGAIVNSLNDTSHLVHPPASAGDQGQCQEGLTLILGGARSGKSDFAQRMAKRTGGDDVLVVATAEAGDEEMERRIEKHRRGRPAQWHTLEASQDLGRAILSLASEREFRTILVDCMTLLTSNLLMGVEEPCAQEVERALMDEVKDLVACAEQLSTHLIVVSNEVGLGVVPAYPLGRTYRDLLGRANQALARKADAVYLLIAGIPKRVKWTT